VVGLSNSEFFACKNSSSGSVVRVLMMVNGTVR